MAVLLQQLLLKCKRRLKQNQQLVDKNNDLSEKVKELVENTAQRRCRNRVSKV